MFTAGSLPGAASLSEVLSSESPPFNTLSPPSQSSVPRRWPSQPSKHWKSPPPLSRTTGGQISPANRTEIDAPRYICGCRQWSRLTGCRAPRGGGGASVTAASQSRLIGFHSLAIQARGCLLQLYRCPKKLGI
ncbi:S-adenosyl-L-methionine-dependentmethyltransferases superfamily protein [Striga asiatica]|uniref:S-adenosyl-L-methionine-dependentmethyltransferases superfamily protein n=1 Tax=Striga asiatica TaxID=4170 RepID=A0A5A7RME3_STRAF|nr:S-adenosyl-L-methionine-dependentmethyltransferases superfamily protein [Striga asiatica]